jgi:FkbM family methyltransferase
MGAVIFWTGYHEFNELRYLHSYFKPEMVFVDVGANQGEFSLFAAKRLPTGKVYAFEPVGDFFSMLKENISLNKFANIEPWKLGLSDKAGSFPIYFDSDHKNQNEGIASLFALPDQQVKETIETITLDSFCSNNQITKVDVIKIDVEGAEFQVLKGSEQVLRNSKPLLMVELSEVNFKAAGYTSKELVGWVTSLGYKMYLIKKGRLIQTNSHPEFCNVIFIHQA